MVKDFLRSAAPIRLIINDTRFYGQFAGQRRQIDTKMSHHSGFCCSNVLEMAVMMTTGTLLRYYDQSVRHITITNTCY